MTRHKQILPSATLGVLGSGQLGRMFAMAARRMGYRVHTLSPDEDTPTGQISDLEITAEYEDLDAVRRFAEQVDVVTIEFENIPAATLDFIAEHVPVRPGSRVLHTTQHRLREKTFLSGEGFPVTPFRFVGTLTELDAAIRELGCPAVLKTAGWGYDGKGQRIIREASEAQAAFESLGGGECVLEAFVDFECELSVVAARGVGGEITAYFPVRNGHERHILDYTVAPADLPPEVEREAINIAHGVIDRIEAVGVLCVEFFLGRSGKLFVNELAPRPHNSGHWTIDGCQTSQFEQQLRAVCGLPLGATDALSPAAMVNLLGDLWETGEPAWASVCAVPGVRLHLYGKHTARPGRKMGHLTALAPTVAEALHRATSARAQLSSRQAASSTAQ